MMKFAALGTVVMLSVSAYPIRGTPRETATN